MKLANTFALGAVKYSEGMRERLGQDWIPKVQDWWSSVAGKELRDGGGDGGGGGAGNDEEVSTVVRQEGKTGLSIEEQPWREGQSGPLTEAQPQPGGPSGSSVGYNSTSAGAQEIAAGFRSAVAATSNDVGGGRGSASGTTGMKEGRLFGWGFDLGVLSAFQQQRQRSLSKATTATTRVPDPIVSGSDPSTVIRHSANPADSSTAGSPPAAEAIQTSKAVGAAAGPRSEMFKPPDSADARGPYEPFLSSEDELKERVQVEPGQARMSRLPEEGSVPKQVISSNSEASSHQQR